MKIFIRCADAINRVAGYIAALLLVPLTLIAAYEVFMRYIVEKPTIWSWDLNIQIFAGIIMLGGGDTLRRHGHVVMDVVVQNLSKRKRAGLDLLTSLFFFFGVIVLLWGGWDQGWASWKAREAMPTVWAPPFYTMKMLIPVGALLLLLQGVAEVFRNLMVLRGSEEGS